MTKRIITEKDMDKLLDQLTWKVELKYSERPGFKQVIDAIKKKRADCVHMVYVSTLSQNPADVREACKLIKNLGAKIIFIKDNVTSEDVLKMDIFTLDKGVAGNGASQSSVGDISKFIDIVMKKDSILYSKELFELAEQNLTPAFSEGRGLGYLVVDENYKQTGKLFSPGSFGHCGHSGQSFFINREDDMYVIILTNATRFLNMKSGFRGYDYNLICKMREDIHNAIYDDLFGSF